jgi:hypothetical protein
LLGKPLQLGLLRGEQLRSGLQGGGRLRLECRKFRGSDGIADTDARGRAGGFGRESKFGQFVAKAQPPPYGGGTENHKHSGQRDALTGSSAGQLHRRGSNVDLVGHGLLTSLLEVSATGVLICRSSHDNDNSRSPRPQLPSAARRP